MFTKKAKLIKIIILVIICAIILVWFLSKNRKQEDSASLPAIQNNQSAQDKQDIEEGTRFAESFLTVYNSYRVGDTSNIEFLYDSMSTDMQAQEKERVAKLKTTFAGFQGYRTIESKIQQTETESFGDNRLILKITIEKNTIDGAFLPDPEGDINDAFVLVDRNGAKYSGSTEDLTISKQTEIYKVVSILETGDWKIIEVQKIN